MDMLAVAALIALAALVQGLTGFGFGLTAMATLPLVVGIKQAVPLVSMLALPLNIILMTRLWRDVRLRNVAPILVGGLAGVPFGVVLLRDGDPRALEVVLGVLLVAFVFWLGREGAVRVRHRAWAVLAGLCGGVLGGAFNTSGPPIVAWTTAQPWSPAELRATLQACFLSMSLLQIALFSANDLITATSVRQAALALPALAVGALAGDALASRLAPARFRVLLRVALGLLGAAMVARALAG